MEQTVDTIDARIRTAQARLARASQRQDVADEAGAWNEIDALLEERTALSMALQ